jgi:hypothetical protein
VYLWDEIVDYWYLYRARVLLGAVAAVAVVVGVIAYHKTTCCEKPPPVQCILLDASGSARGARETYSNLSTSIIENQSLHDGSVCFVDVAGDPAAESDVETMFVGARNRSNSSTAEAERSANQVKAKEAIDQLLQHPPLHVGGSAFVEALALVGPKMRPGQTIHVFSDGIQDSKAFKLRDLNGQHFSEQSIQNALGKLESEGYLPRLPGVKVIFDKPGFQGSGPVSIVDGPSIDRFWRAWGARTKAEVSI